MTGVDKQVKVLPSSSTSTTYKGKRPDPVPEGGYTRLIQGCATIIKWMLCVQLIPHCGTIGGCSKSHNVALRLCTLVASYTHTSKVFIDTLCGILSPCDVWYLRRRENQRIKEGDGTVDEPLEQQKFVNPPIIHGLWEKLKP